MLTKGKSISPTYAFPYFVQCWASPGVGNLKPIGHYALLMSYHFLNNRKLLALLRDCGVMKRPELSHKIELQSGCRAGSHYSIGHDV